MFNVPEQDTNLITERQRKDIEFFLDIANSVCEAQIKPEDIVIEISDRLGVKQTEGGKDRPMRIKFKSSEPKKNLFRNLSKLVGAAKEEPKLC